MAYPTNQAYRSISELGQMFVYLQWKAIHGIGDFTRVSLLNYLVKVAKSMESYHKYGLIYWRASPQNHTSGIRLNCRGTFYTKTSTSCVSYIHGIVYTDNSFQIIWLRAAISALNVHSRPPPLTDWQRRNQRLVEFRIVVVRIDIVMLPRGHVRIVR